MPGLPALLYRDRAVGRGSIRFTSQIPRLQHIGKFNKHLAIPPASGPKLQLKPSPLHRACFEGGFQRSDCCEVSSLYGGGVSKCSGGPMRAYMEA